MVCDYQDPHPPSSSFTSQKQVSNVPPAIFEKVLALLAPSCLLKRIQATAFSIFVGQATVLRLKLEEGSVANNPIFEKSPSFVPAFPKKSA